MTNMETDAREQARMACDCRECGGSGCMRPDGDCLRDGITEAILDTLATAPTEPTGARCPDCQEICALVNTHAERRVREGVARRKQQRELARTPTGSGGSIPRMDNDRRGTVPASTCGKCGCAKGAAPHHSPGGHQFAPKSPAPEAGKGGE